MALSLLTDIFVVGLEEASSSTRTLCDPDSPVPLSVGSWPVEQEVIVSTYSHSDHYASKTNLPAL